MLVVTRETNQTITLRTGAGEVITVKVCGVNTGNARVSIGIEAPRSVVIERDDLKKAKGGERV